MSCGLTDGTLEILKDFAERDNRIHILYSSRKSYGYQVNMGLSAAKGNYVAILETDDFVDKDMYEQLFQIAESTDADFVRSYFYDHIDGRDYYHRYIEDIKVNTVLTGNDIKKMAHLRCIWTTLFKNEFLVDNNICFTETPGASYQDTALHLRSPFVPGGLLLRTELTITTETTIPIRLFIHQKRYTAYAMK